MAKSKYRERDRDTRRRASTAAPPSGVPLQAPARPSETSRRFNNFIDLTESDPWSDQSTSNLGGGPPPATALGRAVRSSTLAPRVTGRASTGTVVSVPQDPRSNPAYLFQQLALQRNRASVRPSFSSKQIEIDSGDDTEEGQELRPKNLKREESPAPIATKKEKRNRHRNSKTKARKAHDEEVEAEAPVVEASGAAKPDGNKHKQKKGKAKENSPTAILHNNINKQPDETKTDTTTHKKSKKSKKSKAQSKHDGSVPVVDLENTDRITNTNTATISKEDMIKIKREPRTLDPVLPPTPSPPPPSQVQSRSESRKRKRENAIASTAGTVSTDSTTVTDDDDDDDDDKKPTAKAPASKKSKKTKTLVKTESKFQTSAAKIESIAIAKLRESLPSVRITRVTRDLQREFDGVDPTDVAVLVTAARETIIDLARQQIEQTEQSYQVIQAELLRMLKKQNERLERLEGKKKNKQGSAGRGAELAAEDETANDVGEDDEGEEGEDAMIGRPRPDTCAPN
ncbi:hypothetical protein ABEF95_000577 [Exophiala dermatitidis]